MVEQSHPEAHGPDDLVAGLLWQLEEALSQMGLHFLRQENRVTVSFSNDKVGDWLLRFQLSRLGEEAFLLVCQVPYLAVVPLERRGSFTRC
jgi:hypothetical protein